MFRSELALPKFERLRLLTVLKGRLFRSDQHRYIRGLISSRDRAHPNAKAQESAVKITFLNFMLAFGVACGVDLADGAGEWGSSATGSNACTWVGAWKLGADAQRKPLGQRWRCDRKKVAEMGRSGANENGPRRLPCRAGRPSIRPFRRRRHGCQTPVLGSRSMVWIRIGTEVGRRIS